MRKKSGFTLVELLAVIIILAIIGLIATPLVLKYVNQAKEKSLSISIDSYERAIRESLMASNIKAKGSFKIMNNGNLCKGILNNNDCNGNVVEVSISNSDFIAGDIYINGDTFVISYYDEELKRQVSKASNDKIDISKESGAGLYWDDLEPGRLVYKGGTTYTNYSGAYPTGKLVKKEKEEPNNYIKFNNTIYRIVSIEIDGTYKIVSDNVVGSSPYDSRDSDTTGHRLNSNNTYCSLVNGVYYGCNAFVKANETIYNGNPVTDNTFINGVQTGTVTENSTIYDYLMDYYNKIDLKSKAVIEPHLFDIGGTEYNTNTQMAKKEQEKVFQLKSSIGLLTHTDWFNATNNSECDTLVNGYYNANNSTYENYKCAQKNYLYTNSWWWLVSALRSTYANVLAVSTYGHMYYNNPFNSGGVRPVFYLKSNIKLIGEGTLDNPYTIK